MDEVSSLCDVGHHQRCCDDDCDCSCHRPKRDAKNKLLSMKQTQEAIRNLRATLRKHNK